MADASYNNGLYTPWTPAGEAAATTSVADWETQAEAATTSEEAWWITTTSSSAATTSMTTASSSTTTAAPTTTSATSSSTSSPSSSPTSSSSSSPSSSSSTSSSAASSSSLASSSVGKHATVSRYVNLPSSSASAASSSSSDGGSSFKITYLIPVFVALPIIILFAILGATYGKCWARGGRKGHETPLTNRGNAWWGGVAGGTWNSRRSRRGPDDDEEEATGGLVEKAAYPSGSPAALAAFDEKRGVQGEEAPVMVKSSSRWGNLFNAGKKQQAVPFLSVSYASLDKPFSPPSRSSSIASGLNRCASNGGGAGDRGWGWGMALPRSNSRARNSAGPSALRQQHNADEAQQDNQHLTAGVWGMGTTSRRYRPKGLGRDSSISSRLSDKIFNRGGGGGLTVPDEMPSPSVYSPAFEPAPVMSQNSGRYTQLGGGSAEDDDEVEEVDYDAVLGAARVGHGDLAKRFVRGEVPEEEMYGPGGRPKAAANPFSQPRDAVPAFKVDLPAAPSRLQVSPKKSKSTLMRPPPPDDGERGLPPPPSQQQLLFEYSSPPVSPEKKRPLPSVPNYPSPTRGLTDAPPRIPFRSQPPPQLSRPPRGSSVPQPSHSIAPPRSMSATPFSPETQPDLFFASPPMSPNASSHGHGHNLGNVGSPLPPFEPGALRASESAFSLDGMDALVFPDGLSSEGHGLKDLVEREKRSSRSRKEEIDQLKRSAPEVKPGMVIRNSVELQASKIPSSSGGRAPSPTKQQQQPGPSRLKKASSKPDLQDQRKSRDSFGFHPSFGDGPAIAPLQHPSKVKAAIETLEKRSSRVGPPTSTSPSKPQPQHEQHQHHHSQPQPRPARMPSPPAAQKLERSTTTIVPPVGAGQRYRRLLGGGRREGDYSSSDDEDGDPEAIAQKRRVSMLILQRSRSQSADGGAALGLLGGSGEGPGSASSHSHSHETVEETERRARPLSSDPKRLSKMLRRSSSAGAGLNGLAIDVDDEEGPVKVGTDGKATGGAMDALTRRSMAL
ncbi:hypothetical protein JCM6882_008845 [Rhodosporidiobolus microsporus]